MPDGSLLSVASPPASPPSTHGLVDCPAGLTRNLPAALSRLAGALLTDQSDDNYSPPDSP